MSHEIENSLVASCTVDGTVDPIVIRGRQGIASVTRNGVGLYTVVLDDPIGVAEETSSCASNAPGGVATEITHTKNPANPLTEYAVETHTSTGVSIDTIWSLNIFRCTSGS